MPYKTPITKVTGVYMPAKKAVMRVGMESGVMEPAPKIKGNPKKKPAGVSDKAWAILNTSGGAPKSGAGDMPRIGKNQA